MPSLSFKLKFWYLSARDSGPNPIMRTSFLLLLRLYYQVLTRAEFCLPFVVYVHSPHYHHHHHHHHLFHMSSLFVFFIVSLILGFLLVCILSVHIFLRSVVFRDFTEHVMGVSYRHFGTCLSVTSSRVVYSKKNQ